MRFERIWVEQAQAARAIKRRFGVKSALDWRPQERKHLEQLLYWR